MRQTKDVVVDEMFDHLNVVKFERETKTYLQALQMKGIKIDLLPHGEIDHEARTVEVKLQVP
tara:strand:- start:330 stop:515 length:186 start_codon:yes stop_codon:yes gene_type:complete